MTTVNLIPNANGDYEHIPIDGGGGAPDHFTAVDDAPGGNDGNTTRLQSFNAAIHRDAYNLAPASAVIPANSVINSVKVFYAFCNYDGTGGHVAYARPSLRLDHLEVVGSESSSGVYTPITYATFNQIIARPGGGAWSIKDIDDLQVVLGVRTDSEGVSYCFFTQVYIQVDYTTAAGLPSSTTNAVSAKGKFKATLNGTLDADGGVACACGFQWGLTRIPYTNTTPTQSKTVGQTFAQTISGLVANTTYHYRTVVTNASGTVYGPDLTFITLPDMINGQMTLKPEIETVNADIVPEHTGLYVDGDPEQAAYYIKILTDDGDTTYITEYGTTVIKDFRFNAQDVGGAIVVNSLVILLRVRREAQFPGRSGTANGSVGIYTHGTPYIGGYSTISDGLYEDTAIGWALNPFTGLAWTAAELDALQIFIRFSGVNYSGAQGGLTSPRVTQAKVIITGISLPTVTTGLPTALPYGPMVTTFHGTLDNDGGAASACGFEWGLTTAYGNVTPTANKTTGQTFTQVIAGLIPGTTYHFRALATNADGLAVGDDVAFVAPIRRNKAYNFFRRNR